jgi:hypothetical protein
MPACPRSGLYSEGETHHSRRRFVCMMGPTAVRERIPVFASTNCAIWAEIGAIAGRTPEECQW